MPTDVIMPALGMAQDTGRLLRWLRAEGDQIARGEPLMEVETDKVTVEVESPASGVLAGVRAAPGDEVPVGQVIAVIVAAGETFEAQPSAKAAAPAPGLTAPAGPTAPAHPAASTGAAASASRLPPASPKARRLARERGIDLAELAREGRPVLAADVESAPSVIWRTMAERMTHSWTVPHFYLVREVRADRLAARREGVTYTDLLVGQVAAALRRHPRLNARWEDGAVVPGDRIHVGIAVALDDGLIVPVIHDADTLSLAEIAERRRSLVEAARAGRLHPEDVRGGTFTITNLGMYGVDAFNAILNPPQAAILAVGRISERVVAEDGQPVVRPVAVLTLSCDHRVVDGARAAQFLDDLARLIEGPDE